ncbi:MAG: hypothetical protein V1799_07480 [bacterium]
MEKCDFDRMKDLFLEFLENDIPTSVTYRAYDSEGSTKDTRFGFVTSKHVNETILNAIVIVNPSNKVKSRYGVSEETGLIVELSTKQLETFELNIQRELSLIVFGVDEYEITMIDPKPRMFETSIKTILGCKMKEPLIA